MMLAIVPKTIDAVMLVKMVLHDNNKKEHAENLTRLARADAPISHFTSYVRNRIFSRPGIDGLVEVAVSNDNMVMAMNIIKMHYSLIVSKEDADEAV